MWCPSIIIEIRWTFFLSPTFKNELKFLFLPVKYMSFKLSLSYFSDTADQTKCAARIDWAFIRNIIIFECFLDFANIMKILTEQLLNPT
jgi:hypothetical protein